MLKGRFLITLTAGLIFGLGGARSVAAPAAAASTETPVHVVITVESHKGSEVPVLKPGDVMVHEGKARDKVVDLVPAQGDHAGLELFVLLDDSSTTSLGTQLDDIRKFILAQPSTTKIGVAYMQEGIARIQQNLTSDHALAAKALRLPLGILSVNGSPYFALSDLMKRWPKSNERREVIMASSGIDRYYGIGDMLDPYLDAAIEDCQRAGVLVSVIYTPEVGHFGHNYWWTYWGQLYLAKLAAETGGESYYIGFNGPPVAFAPFLDDLANHFNHQYLVSFLPQPQKKAGMRAVKVTTEVSNAEIVSANEVYVPATP